MAGRPGLQLMHSFRPRRGSGVVLPPSFGEFPQVIELNEFSFRGQSLVEGCRRPLAQGLRSSVRGLSTDLSTVVVDNCNSAVISVTCGRGGPVGPVAGSIVGTWSRAIPAALVRNCSIWSRSATGPGFELLS